MQKTQAGWALWAQQRKASIPKMVKQYERDADSVTAALLDKGCECDPTIDMQLDANGSPATNTIRLMHQLGCPNN